MEAPFVQSTLKRQTAYKVWLQDIHHAERFIPESSSFFSFFIRDKMVLRVNVIGTIIDLFVQENYGSLSLDDGSAQIHLKVWGDDLSLFDGKNIGDIVLVIGRIGEFDEERYIRPEIVRLVHFDWALFRRLELLKVYGPPSSQEKMLVKRERASPQEVEPSLVARERIISTIEKMEEVDEQGLLAACDMPKEKVLVALYDLLKEGEIFSPKKGFYRLV